MKAELRSIWSIDTEDLATWNPPNEAYALHVRLMVGPHGEDGEESFDLTLCSTAWLRQLAQDERIFDPRHHLILERFDWPTVEEYLVQRVARCEAESWPEVAEKVSRLAYWEFEDYSE
jgi:hypothetical protein